MEWKYWTVILQPGARYIGLGAARTGFRTCSRLGQHIKNTHGNQCRIYHALARTVVLKLKTNPTQLRKCGSAQLGSNGRKELAMKGKISQWKERLRNGREEMLVSALRRCALRGLTSVSVVADTLVGSGVARDPTVVAASYTVGAATPDVKYLLDATVPNVPANGAAARTTTKAFQPLTPLLCQVRGPINIVA